jgi:hypothetical protein
MITLQSFSCAGNSKVIILKRSIDASKAIKFNIKADVYFIEKQ